MKIQLKCTLQLLITLIGGSSLLSNCGTIVGGSYYSAHVTVRDRNKAQIVYNGAVRGTKDAYFRVRRSEANKFSFTLREEGCPDQTFHYQLRTFRGWAFVGTVLGWTGISGGVPLPWGLATDLITGALWKPNVVDEIVVKKSYKEFIYPVSYTECTNEDEEKENIPLIDIVYLKNGSIIRGIIIEQIPNVSIKLKNKDGSIFVFKTDEILKLTRE